MLIILQKEAEKALKSTVKKLNLLPKDEF